LLAEREIFTIMILNRLIPVFIISSITILVIGCVSAPQKPTSFRKGDYHYLKEFLSWQILKDMEKYNVKGLSIAIIDGRKTVWANGFGLADEKKNLPASSRTIYRIGSISKVITATEIMRMYGAGKIDIDQPISTYIKNFSVKSRFEDSKPITARSLLSHHSGLPSDILAGMWVQKPISLGRLVHEIKKESLVSPPQTMYKYSNIGFSVLGRVIEIIEHKPFAKAMNDDLLQPLGMKYSAFELTPQMEKFYAKGYRNGKEAKRTPLRDSPAGSMLSNVDDMGRFVQFIFSNGSMRNKIVIKPKMLQQMFKPQFAGLEMDFGHEVGLDWMLSGLILPTHDRLVWHNGAATPHQAHISLLPEKKLAVVILANTDESSQFITELGIKSLELAVEVKYGKGIPAQALSKEIIPVTVSNEILEKYSGKYVVFGNMTKINFNGHGLDMELWGNKLDLVPVSQDTFVPKATALGFISIPLLKFSLQFKTVQNKAIALLRGLPAPYAFQKIPEYTIPSAWKNRLGSYETSMLDEQFGINKLQLSIEDEVLLFNVTVQGKSADTSTALKIALNPVSDTEAVVIGLANGEGGTVSVNMDGSMGNLYYSGFLFRPVATSATNIHTPGMATGDVARPFLSGFGS